MEPPVQRSVPSRLTISPVKSFEQNLRAQGKRLPQDNSPLSLQQKELSLLQVVFPGITHLDRRSTTVFRSPHAPSACPRTRVRLNELPFGEWDPIVVVFPLALEIP